MRQIRGWDLALALVLIGGSVLLAPVLAPYRESAKGPSCPSNLKQLGTALLIYSTDYDERYPPVVGL